MNIEDRIKLDTTVDEQTGCWDWLASAPHGQPQFHWGSTVLRPRVVLWKMKFGDVPRRFWMHRVCLNGRCINPDHVELVKHHKTSFGNLALLNFERLLDNIMPVTESGCWIWTRYCAQHGYAQIVDLQGKKLYVHRLFYEHYKGPIPAGLTLDHLCRVRCCVNPDHLEPVTLAENVRRGEGVAAQHRRKTHCINGHELHGTNLVHVKSRPRTRVCRICTKARLKISNQKRKEAKQCIAPAVHN